MMSDRKLDGVYDNTWSFHDNWTKCETTFGDRILMESGTFRCTPTQHYEDAPDRSKRQRREPCQLYERISAQSWPRADAVAVIGNQGSAHNSCNGDRYICIAGSSSSAAPLESCGSVQTNPEVVQTKNNVIKYRFEGPDECTSKLNYYGGGGVADIVSSSCQLFDSDICPPEDLEYLVEVSEEAMAEEAFESEWRNIDHIDDLDGLFNLDNSCALLLDSLPPLGDAFQKLQQSAIEHENVVMEICSPQEENDQNSLFGNLDLRKSNGNIDTSNVPLIFDHPHNDEALNCNGTFLTVERSAMEDAEECLYVTVLQQWLNIASKMDTRTRLCIRDSLQRLARNAMERSVGVIGGFKRENSTLTNTWCAADPVSDIVETETNTMDRFIAHLLFHK
ncbi:hypothetical protein KP509_16G082300 [Ceratopteris richardii]|uniref:Uncharacterized protein n=1 Tax=Ceratopteris richardii TaxID=49495 RepID=A0A8T2T4Z9_CERRI|nr:hypothetical protein KP509_16G082300 [Ceratopteris richardii]